MSRTVRIHLSPALFEPEELSGGIAVVIDILRASTTIVHALGNRAERVIPLASVDDTFAMRDELLNDLQAGQHPPLLGGERGGVRIPGFDLTNCPFDYSTEVVTGRTILFTTTNGTAALHHSRQAKQIIIGAFTNLSAVVEFLASDDDGKTIHLVCAGTNGQQTGEDILFAGCLRRQLAERMDVRDDLTDIGTRLADGYAECVGTEFAAIHHELLTSIGGENLTRLGYSADIEQAARVDLFDIVPRFNAMTAALTR